MALNDAYLNTIAAANPITHVGLVDSTNAEVGDARKPVTWTAPSSGDQSMDADKVFNMLNGDDVAGWQGYSALTGGTAYGIVPLTAVSYSADGTYTLLAASTGVNHNAS